MSSSHYIVVARNEKTGEIRLPLGDITLYGEGIDPETNEYIEEELVRRLAKDFEKEWTVSLYGSLGSNYQGGK